MMRICTSLWLTGKVLVLHPVIPTVVSMSRESDCPLRPDDLAGLSAAVDPVGPSTCMGVDKYLAALEYMHSIGYV